jgi:iron complex transport system substrate-binding protein
MYRLVRPLALAAALALALSGCAGAPAAQAPAAPPATAAASFTDARGREVSLAAAPQRIVSLAPSITEILFAVGAAEQVVGVTKFCNYPAEADALPEIGGMTAKTIAVEAIVALKPDLVIGGTTSQAPVVEALEQLGLPVVVFDPASFEEVYGNIEQIGAISGHPEQAAQVAASMRARVERVAERVAAVPADERPAVFYEVFDEPLMTAGPQTFIGQLIELAGASNIFADAAEDYPQVSAEAIVERDPAVIAGPNSHADKLTAELIAARPGWAEISAVRAGRVYLLDADMVSRPGPRLADALEALAAALYPGLFQ